MKEKLLILLFLPMLSSCVPESEIVDEINLISSIGFDYIDDETILATITNPNFKEDNLVDSEIYTEEAKLVQEALHKIASSSERKLALGKLTVILIDEELARRGIKAIKDMFVRDPSIGSRVRLAVVGGSTNEIMQRQFWDNDAGIYLSNMFSQNIETSTIPKTNLHQFTYDLYSLGRDPILPYLSVGEMVKVDQIALFKGDQFVESIPLERTFVFRMLLENFNKGRFSLLDEEEKKTGAIDNLGSKRKIKITNIDKKPKVMIEVDMHCSLREYEGERVSQEVILQLQKDFEKELEKQAKEIIQKVQELGVDPFGIGDKYKSVNRKFQVKKWMEMYPDIEIETKINVSITEVGIKK